MCRVPAIVIDARSEFLEISQITGTVAVRLRIRSLQNGIEQCAQDEGSGQEATLVSRLLHKRCHGAVKPAIEFRRALDDQLVSKFWLVELEEQLRGRRDILICHRLSACTGPQFRSLALGQQLCESVVGGNARRALVCITTDINLLGSIAGQGIGAVEESKTLILGTIPPRTLQPTQCSFPITTLQIVFSNIQGLQLIRLGRVD